MSQFEKLIQKNFMQAVKENVDEKYNEIKPLFTDSELSNLIYRKQLDPENKDLMGAHIQSIKKQLDRLYSEDFLKTDEIFSEFSKSITFFNKITKAFEIDGGTYSDNFIASQNFYLDAVGSCKNHVPNFYKGSMEFACIPLKLRLAIEIYFKNMIGYISSSQEFLKGWKKGKQALYPLSISDLLRFFICKRYKEYCKLPIDIEILKDINFWSNSLVHTGVISFAWQNLEAVELLKPLFNTKHENGTIHIEGFNYLSSDFSQEDLEKDLNDFLSNDFREVSVKLFPFFEKPIEGAFYYPRNITTKSK
ncbi:hypothetical protein EHLJMEHL_01767 [Vreelandella titanicae]